MENGDVPQQVVDGHLARDDIETRGGDIGHAGHGEADGAEVHRFAVARPGFTIRHFGLDAVLIERHLNRVAGGLGSHPDLFQLACAVLRRGRLQAQAQGIDHGAHDAAGTNQLRDGKNRVGGAIELRGGLDFAGELLALARHTEHRVGFVRGGGAGGQIGTRTETQQRHQQHHPIAPTQYPKKLAQRNAVAPGRTLVGISHGRKSGGELTHRLVRFSHGRLQKLRPARSMTR